MLFWRFCYIAVVDFISPYDLYCTILQADLQSDSMDTLYNAAAVRYAFFWYDTWSVRQERYIITFAVTCLCLGPGGGY